MTWMLAVSTHRVPSYILLVERWFLRTNNLHTTTIVVLVSCTLHQVHHKTSGKISSISIFIGPYTLPLMHAKVIVEPAKGIFNLVLEISRELMVLWLWLRLIILVICGSNFHSWFLYISLWLDFVPNEVYGWHE